MSLQCSCLRSKGLSDSHEMAVFLHLYGTSSWVRRTGMQLYITVWLFAEHGMLMYESLKKTCIIFGNHSIHIFSSFEVSGDANFSIRLHTTDWNDDRQFHSAKHCPCAY